MEPSWNTLLSAPTQIRSRSINAENQDGAVGAAARESSKLGAARKGRAFLPLASGHTLTIANITGPGVIRHIWLTLPDSTPAGPYVLRDVILRMYWDDEAQPSVEVPVGDFFCNGFGARALVSSYPIVVAPTGGMNSYFPMPFRKAARIELESQHAGNLDAVYFQIDYTIGDEVTDATSYFHAQWRRTNGTSSLGQDHVILDGIEGAGHYVGTYIALTSLQRFWWGEGEVKFYLDDDEDHPTQVSTGLEDYAGGAWAFQDALSRDPAPTPITFSAPYFGYPYYSAADTTKASPFAVPKAPDHALYRWHLPDPVIFTRALRVTLQQIGAWDHGLFERSDDISSTAYWYQTGRHAPFPELPSVVARTPR
jgi:hypothetical protein